MQRLRVPGIPGPADWQDLRDRFLQVLSAPGTRQGRDGLVMWRLLVKHPWFLAQLKCCAKRVLRRNGSPSGWQVDVEQHAILLLAQKLQRMPDLGIDAALANRHFAGWLATIITQDCRQGLRRLQRLHGHGEKLPEEHLAIDDRVRLEDRVDLNLALAQMDTRERTVVTLWAKGHSIQQISDRLQLSYGRTYRIFTRGLKTLRRMLR